MKAIPELTDSLARTFTFVALSAALCLGARAAVPEPFELKEGDRVLFIGDTFFEREVDYGHIETRLTAAFPDRNVTFRNLAWAADTPMGRSRASFDWNKSEGEWLKRVKEQVALVKPTVAFLSYGMTAALEAAGSKIPEEQQAKIAKFKADMNKLMDAIEEVSGQKVRFVLVGPLQPHSFSEGDREALERLRSVVNAVEKAHSEIAAAKGLHFINLNRLLAKVHYISDGIHPSDDEDGAIARSIVSGGQREIFENTPAYQALNAAVRKKNELFFHRWRPANWTYLFGFRKYEQGQNAVEIPKFDPLIEEWEKRIAKLRDLKRQDPAVVKEVTALTRSAAFQAAEGSAAKEASGKNGARRVNNAAAFRRGAPHAPQPLPTFDLADGFEVNLWAENPLLHKPIQMNWDPQGRLWIASSEVYPQIAPGQPATDSIVVLEDTNGDGKPDRHTVFADGLLIPTGLAPDGKGGCYVAASHQLLHFADTNGDGRADERTIVLSSFGTEDTHHNLHTLRWGYDGHLYMNQSIYTHSHVETPRGVVRLNSGGIWRFNPDSLRLEIFTKGGCNPWGHHWDQWGNHFFTDGAGFKGVYHAMEGATYFTYADMRREAESITPGNWPKFCSLELVHSANFPDDWQGDAITCDFRAHRIVRFKLEENGSTFAGKEMPDLLRSTSVTFRPIDVRFGPDGALYIADWSNPIIQHGEVDFRDPRRDKEHGRIWRVTAKGRPLAKKQDLRKLNTSELLNRTLSKNGWEQEQSRVVLRQNGAGKVLPAVKPWLPKQTEPRARLEAMWLYEAFEKPEESLVSELAVANDERLRAAGARVLANGN